MYFKTAIKNNLGHERRLMWLKGGLTIDPYGYQLMEGCWPDRCNDSERRGFLNELEGGSITVTYVTDLATCHPDNLDNLLSNSAMPSIPIAVPVAPVAPVETEKEVVPVIKEEIAPASDPVPPAIKKLQEQAKKLFAVANKDPQTPAFKFGSEDVDAPRGKEVDLTSKLAHEGSMEDFVPTRKGFTADDVVAVSELPAQEPAFKEVQFKPSKMDNQLFTENTVAPVNQPAPTENVTVPKSAIEIQTAVAEAAQASKPATVVESAPAVQQTTVKRGRKKG